MRLRLCEGDSSSPFQSERIVRLSICYRHPYIPLRTYHEKKKTKNCTDSCGFSQVYQARDRREGRRGEILFLCFSFVFFVLVFDFLLQVVSHNVRFCIRHVLRCLYLVHFFYYLFLLLLGATTALIGYIYSVALLCIFFFLSKIIGACPATVDYYRRADIKQNLHRTQKKKKNHISPYA